MDGPDGADGLAGREDGLLRPVLERRAEWIEALIILATVAAAFVVLDFLARYFQDYFRLILIFFFGWLLAFLISPVADWLQRRLTRLPRGLAVIAVIVPVILIGSLILVRVLVAFADSLVELAGALPGLIANPPVILSDVQAQLAAAGIHIDLVATFQTIATNLFKGLADVGVGLFGGVLSAFGTAVDALIVVSLAVFMAIDRDRILRLGLEITAPEKREDALLFRRSVATAAAGFIRSQLVLGGLYGIWAWIVSLAFGLPYAPATAALSGLIMAIPIYGPYVSWLPPVAVALLVHPDVALIVAVVMLIGWFIDENILAPLVRAGSLDLHPIVVTFAFLLGAQLAGAIGAIVAIPLAAVVQAFVVKYFERYRIKRGWPDPDTDPPATSKQPGTPATEADASG
jgi:predicted PurR-regulated permease PerM